MVGAFAISMIRGRRDRVHFPSARRKMPPIYFAWKATTEGFFVTAGWLARALVVVAALAPWAAPARAESAYCEDLKAEIAQAGGGGDLGAIAPPPRSSRSNWAAPRLMRVRSAANDNNFFSLAIRRRRNAIRSTPASPNCKPTSPPCSSVRRQWAEIGADRGYEAQCREGSRGTPAAAAPLEASRGCFEEVFGLAPPREAGVRLTLRP